MTEETQILIPITPRYGLGDIVEVVGEYESDWRDIELVIVGVVYNPHKEELQYWTVQKEYYKSEGATTDWEETHLRLLHKNKYITRTPAIADGVGVDYDAMAAFKALMDDLRGSDKRPLTAVQLEDEAKVIASLSTPPQAATDEG